MAILDISNFTDQSGRIKPEPIGIVKALLDHGADPNRTGKVLLQRIPPVITAASYGYSQCVKELIRHGASPDSRMVGGGTALMRSNNLATAKVLLSCGANIHAKDDEGHDAQWWKSHMAEDSPRDLVIFIEQHSRH